MSYDFKESKKRIEHILSSNLCIIKQDSLPLDSEFTFDNGYHSWVTALFVDIRNSSALFSEENKIHVSKIIRSFTSEIIEILREDDNLREIGIRGDCVYAIYTTPNKNDIYDIFLYSLRINTFIKMLNTLLSHHKMKSIIVGVGLATAQELVVKAGRKGVNINNKVWIGKAVSMASNLSSLGAKKGIDPVIVSEICYNNFIDKLVKTKGDTARGWFSRRVDSDYNVYYDCNCILSDFDKWISGGMR